jgi:proline iminopeptidase
MLPSHLIDSTKKKNERLSHRRLGQAPPPPMPSLCVTGAMCQQGRAEVSPGVVLVYCIFRPRQLHDERRPPLVVLHGGPSIPSNYLLPIVNGVTDRAIVFYDQWGCGKSSRPSDETVPFSIPTMIQHLHMLVTKQWGLSKFHLLGHSFGGILAYEYLLQATTGGGGGGGGCQSLILASAPTSAALIQEESKRLYREVNDLGADEKEQDEDGATRQLYSETFRQTHECRLEQTPLAMIDALAQAGPTCWRGVQAIADYQATEKLGHIPTLILRGEYDFCTRMCMDGWKDLIQNPAPQTKTLTDCSHYGMLEDEHQYGKAITEFVLQQDRK